MDSPSHIGENMSIPESPYPVYNEPLVMEGDALVLPDPEFPFHHAGFINRVLDLADAWGVKQCVIAGDALHFASLSRWEADWIKASKDGLTPEAREKLLEAAYALKGKARSAMVERINEIGEKEEQGGGVAAEVRQAQKAMVSLAQQFTRIDYVIGNHDARFLKTLDSSLFAEELLKFIDLRDTKWRIAPYYYSVLVSGGKKFRIEHPKSAAQGTAERLASIHLCNIIMGHSHLWGHTMDLSGQYHAIHAGHACDERRMPYAAQRSSSSKVHPLGAVIVRDGWPWLLGENSPWWTLRQER